jgi:hypothetical protein
MEFYTIQTEQAATEPAQTAIDNDIQLERLESKLIKQIIEETISNGIFTIPAVAVSTIRTNLCKTLKFPISVTWVQGPDPIVVNIEYKPIYGIDPNNNETIIHNTCTLQCNPLINN